MLYCIWFGVDPLNQEGTRPQRMEANTRSSSGAFCRKKKGTFVHHAWCIKPAATHFQRPSEIIYFRVENLRWWHYNYLCPFFQCYLQCKMHAVLVQLLLPYQSASGTAGRDSWTAGSCCRKAGTGLHLRPSSGDVFSALLGSCRCKLGAARREREYRLFVHTFSTGIVRDLRQMIDNMTFNKV